MSHFAKIDNNNIVTEVIVSEKDFINSGIIGDEFLWIQTSYNENFRGKYASVGYYWDSAKGVFTPPKPFNSWILNTVSYEWEAPVKSGGDGSYTWDEDTVSWIELTTET
jgi:hypothetical protein